MNSPPKTLPPDPLEELTPAQGAGMLPVKKILMLVLAVVLVGCGKKTEGEQQNPFGDIPQSEPTTEKPNSRPCPAFNFILSPKPKVITNSSEATARSNP